MRLSIIRPPTKSRRLAGRAARRRALSLVSGVGVALSVAALAFAPDPAPAAPLDPDFIVADYRATATISVSLVSAVFTDSGADARDALVFRRDFGFPDSAEDEIGGGTSGYGETRTRDLISMSVSATGYASAAEPQSYSISAAFFEPAYSLNGTSSALLTFRYSLQSATQTNVYDPLRGDAWASVQPNYLEFRTVDYGDGSSTTIASVDSGGSASGTVTALLEPYNSSEDDYTDPYISVFLSNLGAAGDARYTEVDVVPLPAGAPLLFLAMGTLALAAWRKGKR